jgi:hypothetical protein
MPNIINIIKFDESIIFVDEMMYLFDERLDLFDEERDLFDEGIGFLFTPVRVFGTLTGVLRCFGVLPAMRIVYIEAWTGDKMM